MSLSAKDIIRIKTSVEPVGMVRMETGKTLLFTTDTSVGERVKEYSSLAEVAKDYGASTEPYKAAQVYFSQSPYPKNLMIGVWDQNEVVTQKPLVLVGESLSATDEQLLLSDGIYTNSSVHFSDDTGCRIKTTPDSSHILNLSSFSSIEDALPTINNYYSKYYWSANQTRPIVNIEFDTAERRFIFRVYAENSITAGVYVENFRMKSTDAKSFEMLAKTQEDLGVEYSYGTGEMYMTLADSLNAIAEENPAFTFVCEERTLSDTTHIKTIADWCREKGNYIFCCASHDPSVLQRNVNTVFYSLYMSANQNAMGTWSVHEDYKHVSIAGRLSSVDFSSHDSLITANMKVLPSCETDSLDTTSSSILKGQLINFYSKRSGIPMYEEGYTFSPDYWVDTKYWLIWFEDALRVALFNVLYQSKKIPQTDDGISVLQTAIENVCMQGVANGGIASGKVTDATAFEISQVTGNEEFNGYLQKGYLVYIESVSEQDQSDRNQRKAPPIHVWVKGSGAIHSVDVSVLFEQ